MRCKWVDAAGDWEDDFNSNELAVAIEAKLAIMGRGEETKSDLGADPVSSGSPSF